MARRPVRIPAKSTNWSTASAASSLPIPNSEPERPDIMEFIDLKSQYQASRDLINGRIQAVLDHGQYIMGPEVGELETRLAEYSGASHCITVASGTEALLIA